SHQPVVFTPHVDQILQRNAEPATQRSWRGVPVCVVVECVVESIESFVSAELQDVVKIWATTKVFKQPFHESITVRSYRHRAAVLVLEFGGSTAFSMLVHYYCHGSFDHILNRQHMKDSLFPAEFSL